MTGVEIIGASGGLTAGIVYASAAAMKALTPAPDLSKAALTIGLRKRWTEMPDQRVRRVWSGIAICEAIIGVFLLSGAAPQAAGSLGAVGMAAAIGYLLWGLRLGRDVTCGCFRGKEAITWRTVARASAVGASSLLYVIGATSVLHAVVTSPVYVGSASVAQLGLVVALSAEKRVWARDLRIFAARVWHVVRLSHSSVTAARLRLESHAAWRQTVNDIVRSGGVAPSLVQSWRDQEWDLLEYAATYDGEPVSIVAGRYRGVRPEWLKFVMFRETSAYQGQILRSWDSVRAAQRNRRNTGRAPRQAASSPLVTQ